MKICKTCNIELEDNMFGTSKGKNGGLYRRNTCKDCLKAKRRNNPITTITNNPINITDFTDKEILEVILNKNNRIHTVFNLDKDIRDKIKEMAKDKKLNLSDVANLIFRKYFKIGN